MIFFAAANWYSFSATEYRHMQADFGGSTKPFKAIWDAINFSDFIIGVSTSWRAFVSSISRFSLFNRHGKPLSLGFDTSKVLKVPAQRKGTSCAVARMLTECERKV